MSPMAAIRAKCLDCSAGQVSEIRSCERRHGYGQMRTIQTGIGPVEVARAKIRDRGAADDGERIRFNSAILPLWARRTRSLDALLPVLYLRGISTGDFPGGASALLGKDAPNLSPAVVSRLTAEWQSEYDRWQRRDLSARRYVYVWADGVFLQARMEDHGECMLVLIGATPEGKKELIGFQVGVRSVLDEGTALKSRRNKQQTNQRQLSHQSCRRPCEHCGHSPHIPGAAGDLPPG